ncbi:MAG: hypothetical protein K940chlam9_00580 [Chlamydiae bacterium]|nr:hypothetical protein [Chlamydiota bacterium]
MKIIALLVQTLNIIPLNVSLSQEFLVVFEVQVRQEALL